MDKGLISQHLRSSVSVFIRLFEVLGFALFIFTCGLFAV